MQTPNYLRVENGEVYVRAYEAFLSIYPLIPHDTPLDQISEVIRQMVIQEALSFYNKVPSGGSLNNCKGQWNEFSYLYSAHCSILNQREDLYIVKMGNENSIKFWQLYKPNARRRFMDFLEDLKQRDLVVRCSTPDFVLVRRSIISTSIPYSQELFGRDLFDELKNLYKKLINRCEPEDVISFISVKTSNRPDRRYQILYEANITKLASKYIHSESQPLQFHAIGTSNDSDSEVFSAPLLASLPNIEGPIIDSDSQIITIDDLETFWKQF
ncbi:Cfr10I/Bse634I family restriction endonuclease [Leptolyngbya ohadii]|uniref:Cfr10I/Bse634I family restriction endonuclease n=1 Tax=Leptolyngbya ohadii TaxID=1962290 RepID=UPI000B59A54E|nr:Cfr10I/Bse634I family restriction endonuclease [Leptolyngbya ohadii]